MAVAEVITVERRRRWKLVEKRQLVAEALEPGASVSEESLEAVSSRRGRMEIALRRGCRITVFADVDGGALARVLDVLDRR